MPDAFHIYDSQKVGLDSDESYVVVRTSISYLRVLGREPKWELMTPTASEDHGRIKVCSDQLRLMESALRLGAELGTEPRVEKDRRGREYVKICVIKSEPDESDEDFQCRNAVLFEKFFDIFDDYRSLDTRAKDEMRELYDVLATDDQDSEVYLSDGMWLGSDGSLLDRGR